MRYNNLRTLVIMCMLLALTACAIGSGKKQQAETVAAATRQSVALTPEQQAQLEQAIAYYKNNSTDQAERILKQLVQQQPNNPMAALHLGIIYWQTERYSEAKKSLETVITLGLEQAEVYNLLGSTAVKTGEFATAISYYEKAIEQNASYAPAYYNLGLLYDVYLQDIKAAVQNYEQYLKLAPEKDEKTAIWVEQLKKTL